MNERFGFAPTPLAGLLVVERKPLTDARGSFERIYCADELGGRLGGASIAQINRSFTRAAGTVRGMHFQYPPHTETKLVSCLRGEIFDVAVDLRRGSSTFLRWYGLTLSEGNHRTLLIPGGFAHGFQTLTDDCELLYLHTAPYVPAAEGGLDACDPALGIAWPRAITGRSARDVALPVVEHGFAGIER